MQFQVPQFIDISPKLVGPLTLRQFLYIAGATLLSFLLFFVLQFLLWIVAASILVGVATALAFVKVNDQPLERMTLAAFQYFWNPRMYLWKRAEATPSLPTIHEPERRRIPDFKEMAGALSKSFAFTSKPTPKKEPESRKPLSDLSLKMATTIRPIEKREKPAGFFGMFAHDKEQFEEFRKTTGERKEARRIDYR